MSRRLLYIIVPIVKNTVLYTLNFTEGNSCVLITHKIIIKKKLFEVTHMFMTLIVVIVL